MTPLASTNPDAAATSICSRLFAWRVLVIRGRHWQRHDAERATYVPYPSGVWRVATRLPRSYREMYELGLPLPDPSKFEVLRSPRGATYLARAIDL